MICPTVPSSIHRHRVSTINGVGIRVVACTAVARSFTCAGGAHHFDAAEAARFDPATTGCGPHFTKARPLCNPKKEYNYQSRCSMLHYVGCSRVGARSEMRRVPTCTRQESGVNRFVEDKKTRRAIAGARDPKIALTMICHVASWCWRDRKLPGRTHQVTGRFVLESNTARKISLS